ncbi:hypothetical protein [Saccharopolyspora sp. SCSIO 74807]
MVPRPATVESAGSPGGLIGTTGVRGFGRSILTRPATKVKLR